MSHTYTALDFDARRATRGFASLHWSTRGRHADKPARTIAQSAPPWNDHIGVASRSELSHEAKGAGNGSKNRATASPPDRQPAWTENDMSASTATLTLLLLATVAAVHSDHPTFWLSIGPAPLAAGLAALTFFRRKYGRHRRTPPDRTGDLAT
jgi:hypothetical protein